MVKIALDPAMYHATMSVAGELRKAADLGYEYLELSPRSDWFFWHRYPKADDAMIAEVNQAVKETGVRISSLVPVFGWSADAIHRRTLERVTAELAGPGREPR
jgi:myo-inositol catabolism protein IolH